MKVSWDDYSQYMGKNMFQTTKQLYFRIENLIKYKVELYLKIMDHVLYQSL